MVVSEARGPSGSSRIGRLDGVRALRHALCTAAQVLILSLDPIHSPGSKIALDRFIQFARSLLLSPAEIDGVLVRSLAVLDPHHWSPPPEPCG
jgi:hypothetical protein